MNKKKVIGFFYDVFCRLQNSFNEFDFFLDHAWWLIKKILFFEWNVRWIKKTEINLTHSFKKNYVILFKAVYLYYEKSVWKSQFFRSNTVNTFFQFFFLFYRINLMFLSFFFLVYLFINFFFLFYLFRYNGYGWGDET